MSKTYQFMKAKFAVLKQFLAKIHPFKLLKSNWNFLYLALAALILLSVFAIPKIAVSVVEQSRGKIVTVESTES